HVAWVKGAQLRVRQGRDAGYGEMVVLQIATGLWEACQAEEAGIEPRFGILVAVEAGKVTGSPAGTAEAFRIHRGEVVEISLSVFSEGRAHQPTAVDVADPIDVVGGEHEHGPPPLPAG